MFEVLLSISANDKLRRSIMQAGMPIPQELLKESVKRQPIEPPARVTRQAHGHGSVRAVSVVSVNNR